MGTHRENKSATVMTEVWEAVQRERKLHYRFPLFVIGSAISSDRIPMMDSILKYFSEHNELSSNLREQAWELISDNTSVSRDVAADMFYSLQFGSDHASRAIWKEFTDSFVSGALNPGTFRDTPIYNLLPTEHHMTIAKELIRSDLPGIGVSLNYDGLTAKAMRALLVPDISKVAHLDPLFPVRILSEADEVTDFFTRRQNSPNLFPLIKLKGDVFYTVCRKSGCMHKERRIPLYYFPLSDLSNLEQSTLDNCRGQTNPSRSGAREKEKGEKTFKETSKLDRESHSSGLSPHTICPGCNTPLPLILDFPGYGDKESDVRNVLTSLMQLVMGGCGIIVTFGVSGNWDEELVKFLSDCVSFLRIPIFCLDYKSPAVLEQRIFSNISSEQFSDLVRSKKIDFLK